MAAAAAFKLIIFLIGCVGLAAGAGKRCRCLSTQACWPSDSKWAALNESVDGQLIAVKPPAAPCHDSKNPKGCSFVNASFTDPFWRSDQPGAQQSLTTEILRPNEACALDRDTNSSCFQGALPLYAVNVSRSVHVQKAVAFASKYNLRLVIKNTGHDLIGRSTAPESLSIWVHNLKNIIFSQTFSPCKNSNNASEILHTVKVGAGVQWEELYKAAFEKKRTVVGGECNSVGVAGGYVQGGGHSQMAPSFGLAADNIVEYQVVKADGTLVTANACENEELFWALRGGGGGTFGVVISATYPTFSPLHNLIFASYVISSNTHSVFHEFLSHFLKMNPKLSDEFGWGGRFILGNNTLIINYLLPNHNFSFASHTLSPLLSFAQKKNLTVTGSLQDFPSYYEWHLKIQCPLGKCSTYLAGVHLLEASRLIPRSTLTSSSSKLASVLTEMYQSQPQNNLIILGYLVGGGKVSIPHDNALNPVWRKAVLSILIGLQAPNAESAWAKRKDITNSMQKLRDLTPGSGTYFNEGDINEPDWQKAYFGVHYEKLKAIKQKVDSKGLFTCRHCVGSEDWNEEVNYVV